MKPQSTLYIPMSFIGFMLIFMGLLLILCTQFIFMNPGSVLGGSCDLIGAIAVAGGAWLFIEELTARATSNGYDKPEP